MSEVLEIIRKACPYPSIDDVGTLHKGIQIHHPVRCERCATKACRERLIDPAAGNASHQECEHGLSTVLIQLPVGRLLLNGLNVPLHNSKLTPQQRKQLRPQKVSMDKIAAYAASVLSSLPGLQREIDHRVSDALASMHDIKTAVTLVFRNAEAIVRDLPGEYDDEKIEGADPALKGLLKSVSLLRSRLDLASILANPESAKYGQLRTHPIYRLCHRFVRLFEQEAQQRSVRLHMGGRSFNTPLLYDSIDTIPLVLIDNAIKYALPNTEVYVNVHDITSPLGCEIIVESTGPLVPVPDRGKIFERGFRSSKAKAFASSGSGLGLYIAKLVADANDCEIVYKGVPRAGKPDEGKNIFSFRVFSLQH